eukprot:TRINITY_DN3165_c0_g2_i2.p1 TRINITY_DN3165_c0_g2~~TRINITY_DN3165_c0_g2_i2.p1  ORF type:complete len:271 (+),score=32.90 TRINITY_DN3165_c0_g2_i2:90-902(+)
MDNFQRGRSEHRINKNSSILKGKITKSSQRRKDHNNFLVINAGNVRKTVFRRAIKSMHSRRQGHVSRLQTTLYVGKLVPSPQRSPFDDAVIGSKLASNLRQNEDEFHLKRLPEVGLMAQDKDSEVFSKNVRNFYRVRNPTWTGYETLESNQQSLFNFLNAYANEMPIKIVSIPISKTRMTLENFYATHTADFKSRNRFYNNSVVKIKKVHRISSLRGKTAIHVNNSGVRKMATSFYGDLCTPNNNEDLAQYKFQVKIKPKKIIHEDRIPL